LDQLTRLFGSLTTRQKLSLLVAAAAVVAMLYGLAQWNKERDFKPLYTGLAPEDAGQVVSRLRETGAEYRLADNGSTILVPSGQVAESRLQLAVSGLPQTGRLGFELFDQTNFGATDFTEQVNYRRALEGELERSVMALMEVERARVHLTLPQNSVFLESRRPAKASVLLKLRPTASLSAQNVQAIAHLVSSAVEGLEPSAISILDMRGNLLSRPLSHGGLQEGEPSDALIEYRQGIERNLLAKINGTLDPLLGPDKFRAGVSVECDFTSGEQSEEFYDPSRAVLLSAL
jgi:flagellar M-ring protein FliF